MPGVQVDAGTARDQRGSRLLEELRAQDWDRIGRALVLHARRRAGIRAWREGAEVVGLPWAAPPKISPGTSSRSSSQASAPGTRTEASYSRRLNEWSRANSTTFGRRTLARRERAEPETRGAEAPEKRRASIRPDVAARDPQLELERAEHRRLQAAHGSRPFLARVKRTRTSGGDRGHHGWLRAETPVSRGAPRFAVEGHLQPHPATAPQGHRASA